MVEAKDVEKRRGSTGSVNSKNSSNIIPEDNNPWPNVDDDILEQSVQSKHHDTELRRVASKSAQSTASSIGPPPDGGTRAWVQCLMVHLTIFSTWGFVSSYGVFQTYYSGTLDLSPSAISWLGSVQIFLLFFIGTFSGRALDAGLFRPVYITGSVLQLLGIFTLSFATTYWQLFLAQAVCTGISNGLQFCPSMSLLTTYFAKRRNLAVGLAALGSCTGGVVFPILVQQLLPRVGFGWTIRAIGFIMLLTNILTITCYRTRLQPRKSGPLIEWNAFKEPPYTLYIIGMFFSFWGLYFAFFYVGSYGRNILGFSYQESINLLLAMVATGFLFRVIPSYYADKLGPLNTMIPFTLLCCIMMFAWIGIHSGPNLYAFAVIYGAGSAGMQSLFASTLSSLTTDLRKAGVRMGMGFTIVSFACLTGPPLAGALIQINGGDYLYAQIWGGLSFLVGSSFLLSARVAKAGWNIRTRI